MTSQKDQIQALIVDIDGVLQKTTPRLPWVMSGEVAQQRQVLERVRNYLIALQRRLMVQEGYGQPGSRSDLLAHDIYDQSPQVGHLGEVSQTAAQPEATAQQMLQTVIQEMGYLRANLMQPLQADLETLRQQREVLVQEIHQLEAQRQGYGLTPQANQQQLTAEFLQALLGRLQETLPQQMAQIFGNTGSQSLPYTTNSMLMGAADPLTMPPLPSQSSPDQLIVNLDSTLKVIFESLERNVQAYQESLAQGLDRMHGLGQQGEVMFTALINHLAQQLGREASTYLQSSGQFVEVDSADTWSKAGVTQAVPPPINTELSDVAETTSAAIATPNFEEALENLQLPYAGAELPVTGGLADSLLSNDVTTAGSTSPSSVDAAIDAWLRSAQTGAETSALENFTVPGLDLGSIDLSQVDAQNIDTILEMAGIDLSQSPVASPSVGAQAEVEVPAEEDTADIDAALKLLEQLSSEFQDESALSSLEDTEAVIERILIGAEESALDAGGETAITPDDAHNELDEFYESLFGEHTTASDREGKVAPVTQTVASTVDRAAVEAPTTMAVELATDIAVAAADIDPTLGWDVVAATTADLAMPTDTSGPNVDGDIVNDQFDQPEFYEQSELIESDATALLPALGPEAVAMEPVTDAFEDLFTTLPGAQPEPGVTVSTSDDPTEAPGIDQVSSLTDLFDDSFPEPTVSTESATVALALEGLPQTLGEAVGQPPFYNPEGTQPAAVLELGDDRYTPASPEEDLLPEEAAFGGTDSELWLDENTLHHLSEDLSSLEVPSGRQPSPMPTTDLLVEATDAPGLSWALDETPLDPASDRLTEAATNLGIFGSDNTAVHDEPSTAAFSLEGMDDLFADQAAKPSVSPVPPPATTPEDLTSFTLGSIQDLFADPADVPSAVPVAPPAGTSLMPPEVESASIESLPTAEVASPLGPTAVEQSIPFTLEGMDDLFADVPPKFVPDPLPGTAQAGVVDTSPSSTDTLANFTLEGIGDLLGDVAPVDAPMPAVSPALSPEPTFTLEGMNDLFSDAPFTEAVRGSVTNELTLDQVSDIFDEDKLSPTTPADTESPAAFTLEQIGDLFMETPTSAPVEPVETPEPAAFTLEQIGDLFVETRTSAPAEPAVPPEPAAFTLEQIGDLFVETPTSASANPSIASDPNMPMEPDAFTLDQIGDLFVEMPTSQLGNEPTTESATIQSDPNQALFDELTLEQAFESLMGSSAGTPPSLDPSDIESPTSEKKKKAP